MCVIESPNGLYLKGSLDDHHKGTKLHLSLFRVFYGLTSKIVGARWRTDDRPVKIHCADHINEYGMARHCQFHWSR